MSQSRDAKLRAYLQHEKLIRRCKVYHAVKNPVTSDELAADFSFMPE